MTADADVPRAHAEDEYASELAGLRASDDRPRPPGWTLSPWAVVGYVMDDGDGLTPKYFGRRRLIEMAVATPATDRALLLLGVPGRRRRGSASTWRRPSPATRCRSWGGRRAPPRRRSATRDARERGR